jgi:ABC-type transport system involved in multi-copper enzyme maturation permease subunit
LEEAAERLVGPLAPVEAARLVSRTWVLVLRRITPIVMGIVLLMVIWVWWLSQGTNDNYSPLVALRGALVGLLGLLITCSWLLTPALLAGTLSGERMQASLALLFACQVSSREIVLGRLIGRLAIFLQILLASLPALALAGGLCGLNLLHMLLIIALPLVVAFGNGGLACAASVYSRRGRDALLAVYLFDILLLLAPLFVSLLGGNPEWVAPLDPYWPLASAAGGLTWLPAALTIATWTIFGVLGVALAAMRLRSASLQPAESTRRKRRILRRHRVPPVGKRPMVWKELYIEQMRTVNRIARLLGLVLIVLYLGGSFLLAGLILLGRIDPAWSGLQNLAQMQYRSFAFANTAMAWLIQWAIGLRAAVSISSERERNTWDSLLCSPLDGLEIVTAKLYGNLYALRGLAVAVLIGWVLALISEALPPEGFIQLLILTLCASMFMAALGIHVSLTSASPTRAMAITISLWIAAAVATQLFSLVVIAVGYLAVNILQKLFWPTWMSGPGPFFGAGFSTLVAVLRCLLYVAATILLAAYCGRRFDRLAGRTFAPSFQMRRRMQRLHEAAMAQRRTPAVLVEALPAATDAEPHASESGADSEPRTLDVLLDPEEPDRAHGSKPGDRRDQKPSAPTIQ